jgi:hypothetical protein
MHNFIVSVLSSLIKLLWVFVSSPSKSTFQTTKSQVGEPTEYSSNELEVITEEEEEEEVSKLEHFLEGINNAKSSSERLELLIEFEEDEKMRELLIKMRRN